MRTSDYKKWIVAGGIVFLGSAAAAVIVTYWGIYAAFDAIESNPAPSLDSVQSGIETALFGNIVFGITALLGLVCLTIGCVKAYRRSKSAD